MITRTSYLLFIDESGTHDLRNVDPRWPAFVLLGLLVGEFDDADARQVAKDGGDVRVARLTADGSLDAAFGDGGFATLPFDPVGSPVLAVQPDGKVVVAGAVMGFRPEFPAGEAFAVARLLPTGAPDASFAGDGLLEFNDAPLGGMYVGSAFGVGTTRGPALSVTRVRAGQSLLVAAALDGQMRPDFPFFPAFTERGSRCAGDVRLFAERDFAIL